MRFVALGLAIVILAARAAEAADVKRSTDLSSLIDISVESSRKQPTAGSGLGISAVIKNRSDTASVFLHSTDITVVVPPELQGATNEHSRWEYLEWVALFPTEGWNSNRYDTWITIKPGHSYKIFYSPCPDSLNRKSTFFPEMLYVLRSELEFLFFLPGDYKIDVVAKYWTNQPPKNATNGPADHQPQGYFTTTESITLQIAAPQTVVIIGAMAGGLIAYFILPHCRRRLKAGTSGAGAVGLDLAGALGACLLSAIITILLSRISETQFLIRVTINDIWGAVAVGFVANYAGVKLLNRILASSTGNEPTDPQTKKADGLTKPPKPETETQPETIDVPTPRLKGTHRKHAAVTGAPHTPVRQQEGDEPVEEGEITITPPQ